MTWKPRCILERIIALIARPHGASPGALAALGLRTAAFSLTAMASLQETTVGSYPACRTEGTQYGVNRAAKRVSLQDIKTFVTRVFGLPEPAQ